MGIGFLAGGVILKTGASIRGLTTAANLWITAAVGTAVGLGMLLIGSVAAAITLLALVGLRPVRRVLERHAGEREEFVVDADRGLNVQALLQALRDLRVAIREVRVNEEAGEQNIRLTVRMPSGVKAEDVVALLTDLEHVHNVDWTR